MTSRDGVGIGLAAALLGMIALHFFEPQLGITWSYAHLGRDGWRVAVALLVTIAFPVLGAWAWTRDEALRPLAAWRPGATIAAGALFVGAMALLGGFAPAPASNYDSTVLLESLRGAREAPVRWLLGAALLEILVAPFRSTRDLAPIVGALNSAFATIGLLGLACAAREMARTRREAVAVVALVWSAFGTLQISIGYIEIYPLALGFLGVYIALGARVLRRDRSLIACAVVAALAPFFYVGLSLLVPSTLVLGAVVLRREHGARRAGAALAAGLVAASLATLPGFGAPFAWLAFAEGVASVGQLGLQSDTTLVPLDYLFSLRHLSEIGHAMLLVDGVGGVMLLGPGVAVLASSRLRDADALALFLAAIAVPFIVYVFAMDPIYGAYQDWDLWATGSPAISLLGAWAFIVWSRDRPRLAGALCGLALACATVHALARLHAMPLDSELHLRESPSHIAPRPPARAPGTTRQAPRSADGRDPRQVAAREQPAVDHDRLSGDR